MAVEENKTSTPGVDPAVLKRFTGKHARVVDAPICAQALLCRDIFQILKQNVLWIAADVREMERLHESLRTLVEDTAGAPSIPPQDIHLFQPMEKDPAVFGEHLKLVQYLTPPGPHGKSHDRDIFRGVRFIIVTCPQALEQEVPLAGESELAVQTLRVGEEHHPQTLTGWMSDAGYEFGVEVYSQGEAALRGGILDCWPPGSPRPVRIEFFGDEIDSIRYFDDQTQCSIEKIDSVQLPQMDFGFAGEDSCPITDLLPENTLIVNPDAAEDLAQRRNGTHEASLAATRLERSGQAINTRFDFYDTGLVSVSYDTHPKEAEQARRRFVDQRCADASADWSVHFYFETRGTLNRFRELYEELEGFDALQLHHGVLHESAIDHGRKFLIVTESDFYAYHTNRNAHARNAKRFHKQQERVSEAADIQPGDFVVHVEHGVGKYLGLVETSFSGKSMEVLCIEYAKGEKVYLPVTQAHLLTRYKGMGKNAPKPHTLGGRKWKNDKAGAEEAVQDFASQLLLTQAERQAKRGYRFSKDTAMQAEFEAAFPYTETPDQLSSSDELKRDMEKLRPMDRLLCGDVGFGKTEVAMRAAFKAVMDGMQVAVLVPTTILAQQHYDTFAERMAAFPIRIDMVSRFRSRAEQNKTLVQTLEGEVDILIGTHRILSKDVNFKNLGLVIIDEEQRFGVTAKEHLKELRKQVDVITMSATPIPRTLYMSLTGVRDLSTIKTAPQERQPVDTNVIPYDEEIITEAIRAELHRDGQVFYLHNRVKTIHLVETRLMTLVPEARIAVAHGQMGETELSQIMHAFVEGRFDVLLCTTIIESGVDIPNCNTLIVENAERFGLSDLYQLRGRVGRSNHKAFAFLMLSPGGDMIDAARDRMNAIKRYTGLGSGFRLALRDLELRGAGNMLGAKQSGHISAVGFDLYCQLLKRTIAILQGKKPPPLMDVTVKIDFLDLSPKTGTAANGAYIPYDYIEDENLRLRLYQRMSALATKQEITLMKREIKDRFGRLPQEVHRLMLIAELRIVAADHGLKSVIVRKRQVMLSEDKQYRTFGGMHPRLEEDTTTPMLKELIELIKR
ncbi:Transcription-repair-coupling factor [Pontiella desulfatans]|uniref:Transcription-repair-coupling factor n=1 Tax=Pontiella desulfatans TaxID=2750659 RepID=A0A6C2U2R6_PONDE|nr:transcription-repair coupling factor [Pontiella desulfatans]VGO14135.1 Transcription-repair-coupling factor [Pontiella desulfatans]